MPTGSRRWTTSTTRWRPPAAPGSQPRMSPTPAAGPSSRSYLGRPFAFPLPFFFFFLHFGFFFFFFERPADLWWPLALPFVLPLRLPHFFFFFWTGCSVGAPPRGGVTTGLSEPSAPWRQLS